MSIAITEKGEDEGNKEETGLIGKLRPKPCFRSRYNAKNRVSAAYMFMRNVIRVNTLSSLSPDYEQDMNYRQRLSALIPKENREQLNITTKVPEEYDDFRYFDRVAGLLIHPVKKPIIYATGVSGFVFGLVSMKYDKENEQFVIGGQRERTKRSYFSRYLGSVSNRVKYELRERLGVRINLEWD